MNQFDPTKPALVHDKLNNKTFSWEPDRHGVNYEKYAQPFDPGVIEWDGLLLDGWEPLETGASLIERIERYAFECDSGPLRNCIDWHKLKASVARMQDALTAD